MRIDHIGIAVKDLGQAIRVYEKLLNRPCLKQEVIDSQRVKAAFFETGESKIELLSPTADDSVISKFLSKRGEGVHHIAFETDNIEEEMKRLQQEGFTLLSDKPVTGANGKRVIFLHPKQVTGVLVELCETMASPLSG